MNSSRSGWVAVVGLGLLLAAFPLVFARNTATLDAFLQLIMAEGFLKGTGYGFYENGEFVAMSSRPPAARWPPGISMMAAGLSALRLDPVVTMVWVYPAQIVLLYGIFLFALKPYCSLPVAAVIAFSAATPALVLGSFTRLNSEAYALPAMALLFLIVVSGPGGGAWKAVVRAGVAVTVISVVLTMMRFAGAYLVAAVCVLFAMLWLRGTLSRLAFIASTGFASAAPLIVLLLYLGPAPPDPEIGDELPAVMEAYWESPYPVWLGREWFGHLQMLAEVATPRIGPVFRQAMLPAAIGAAALGFVLFVLLRQRGKDGLHRVCMVASWMVFGYLALLAVTAAHFRMPWSLIYRVNGFIQPLAIIAFSAALLLAAGPRYRSACIAIILAIAVARYAHSWRYESMASQSRMLNQDYRLTIRDTESLVRSNFPQADTIVVEPAGHWGARYFLRQLWYSERFGEKLPWKVRAAKHAGVGSNRPDQLSPSAVLILHQDDYENLPMKTRESVSSGRVKALRYFQFVILGTAGRA